MLGNQLAVYSLFALLCLAFRTFEAAKILGLFPFEAMSQCILLSPYQRALAQRGHELTIIHAYPQCVQEKGVRYIRVYDLYNVYGDFYGDEFTKKSNKWKEINLFKSTVVKMSLNVLQNVEVQALLQSNTTFDLVIVESSQIDSLYGFAAHFNASLMGFVTVGSDWNIDSMVGFTSSVAEPIMPQGFTNGLTLHEQLYNWVYLAEEWLFMKLIIQPKLRELHEQFFPNLDKTFAEIGHSFSIILLNQHFSFGRPRPNVPGIIEVAGLHLQQQVPPLPRDLEEFIDQSKNGVIYFALGLEMSSKDLSSTTLSMLLETFESLPQRVIWKFEGSVKPNASADVYMSPWLPQHAILAHSNVQLFITHGGALSMIEAVYYAKPIVGLPHFYDQFRNVNYMADKGMGLSLDLNTLTKPVLSAAISEVVNNSKYHRNAVAFSQRFRDQPMHPLDSAVYWTEYVIRYKGAPHMRVAATNIKFIDYYNLDKVFIIFFRLALIVALVVFTLYKLRCFLRMGCVIWYRLLTAFSLERRLQLRE